jgi:hypothetical protein
MASEQADTDRSFRRAVLEECTLFDLLLLGAVPVVLVGVFQLPDATRTSLAFDVSEPTVVTAYTSYFVHLALSHLVGNVLVYLVVAPLAYLLLALSGQRQLFRWSLVAYLTVFPFALSTLQLVFPRSRVLVGFSGINAALFGLLCFGLVVYAGETLAHGIDERHSPILLFFTIAMIAFVTVPERAWSTEITAVSVLFGAGYLGAAVHESGLPSREAVGTAVGSSGYFELAGGGLGVLFAYPFVGFQENVIAGVGTVDAYVHLLGYCLAFIVVYVFVFVVDVTEESRADDATTASESESA